MFRGGVCLVSTTHSVMGTTMDDCRYIKALLAPCERATTVGGN